MKATAAVLAFYLVVLAVCTWRQATRILRKRQRRQQVLGPLERRAA